MAELKNRYIRLLLIFIFSYILSACMPTKQSVILDTIRDLGSSEMPYKPIKLQVNIDKKDFVNLIEMYLANFEHGHYFYDESTNKIQTSILTDKGTYQEFQLNIELLDSKEYLLVIINSEFSFYSPHEERRIGLSYKIQQENTHRNVRETFKALLASQGIEIRELN